MVEKFNDNKPFSPSRRRFMIGSAAFGGATLIGADLLFKDGLMMDSPDLTPKPKKINTTPRGMPLTKDILADFELKEKPLRLTDRTYVYYNTDNDLLFQHKDSWFEEEREYAFSHRAGNKRKMVGEALKKGANGIDMDVASLPNGKIIAAHGIVGDFGVGPFKLGGEIDPDPMGIRTRIPRTAADMLNYLGSKSTPENPLYIAMELKRGSFNNHKGLFELIAGISRNGLPTWVFSPSQNAIDNLYGACTEYSQTYGPTT